MKPPDSVFEFQQTSGGKGLTIRVRLEAYFHEPMTESMTSALTTAPTTSLLPKIQQVVSSYFGDIKNAQPISQTEHSQRLAISENPRSD